MTIDLRPPRPDEEPRLQALFTEAFHDADFTKLFFETGFSPTRCFVAAEGDILAALHWFDCTALGKHSAYIFGVATFERFRGKGLGSRLMEAALDHLKRTGYESVLLVPASPGLFDYYARFGFQTVSTIRVTTVRAAVPLPIRKVTAEEYASLRRQYLPAGGVLQEGPILEVLAGYADLYATDHALCALSGNTLWELLGDENDAPGILAALGLSSATVRTPGPGRPFAMGLGMGQNVYFGLALD